MLSLGPTWDQGGQAGSSDTLLTDRVQDAFNDPALPNNADEWIEDLALMHHYTSNTTSMGPRGNRVCIHELYTPPLAFILPLSSKDTTH